MKTGKQFLSIVEFVVNNSPAQSTGYTPFFLNFWLSPMYSNRYPQGLRRDYDRDCQPIHPEDAAGIFSSPILFTQSAGTAKGPS